MDRQHLMKMAMLALAVAALVYMASIYSKNDQVENFDDEGIEEEGSDDPLEVYQDDVDEEAEVEQFSNPTGNQVTGSQVTGVSNNDNASNYESIVQDSANTRPGDCFPKDQLTPGELLPADSKTKWSESVPAAQGELEEQNFLTAGYHVGVNTVGQSLRNANRQIRSEPPNPQVKVSPWLQTTIDTDANRRPLEIGGCQ
jgi:hypothetical protein